METTVFELAGYEQVPADGPVAVELPRRLAFKDRLEADESVGVEGTLALFAGRYLLVQLELTSVVADWAPDLTPPTMMFGENGVTNELLRSVAIERLIVAAVAEARPRFVVRDSDRTTRKSYMALAPGRTIRRNTSLTLDEQVVVLYHLAYAADGNTNVLIANQLGISKSAAAQRVARLRKKNWLPPARKQGARR